MTSFPKFQYAASPIASMCREEYTMMNILNLSSVQAWQSWGWGGDVVGDSRMHKLF